MRFYLNLTLIIASILSSCTATNMLPATGDPHFDNSYKCYGNNDKRIGAICNDSTYSKSTGAGACSHHGDVKVWLCR